jgi:ATP-independent RNA helicase DbpA
MSISTEQLHQYLQNLGFDNLNELQHRMLNSKGKNRILLSQTGSGKTVGFLLPLLSDIQIESNELQALIIAPTRELAAQIEHVFKSIKSGLKITTCYGGHSVQVERKSLEGKTQVVIGTPGRICDHIDRGRLDLSHVKTLVIDEYDKCLEFGFLDQLAFITNELIRLEKTTLVSATELAEIPDFFPVKDFESIHFLNRNNEPDFIKWKVTVRPDSKFDGLLHVLTSFQGEQTIVFCNFREATEKIVEYLDEQEYPAVFYHGGMEQDDRERSLLKFRNGSEHTLVCTDLGSRGLDIPEIKHVVHFQYPHSQEAFTHRNGRTARIQKQGNIYLMVNSGELVPDYIEIPDAEYKVNNDHLNPVQPEWITLYFSGGKKNKINKVDLVGFLLQKANLSKDEIGLISVLDFSSFVAVKRSKVKEILKNIQNEKIKGQKHKISIAR